MNATIAAKNRESSIAAGRVLLVDDEPAILDTLGEILTAAGHDVTTAADVDHAQTLLLQSTFDAVVTDLAMPGASGLNLVEWASTRDIDCSWIILTGSGRYEDAIEAVRIGAHDYLCKPVSDLGALHRSVANAIDRCRTARERKRTTELVQLLNAELHARMEVLEGAISASAHKARVMADEIEQVRAIERSLLPQSLYTSEKTSTYALYRPSAAIGGDLYDVFPIGPHHMGFFVADASGHGISAALLAALLKPSIQPSDPASPLEPRRPAEVLDFIAQRLHGHTFEASMFVTLAYGVIDTRDMSMRFASAGHPPALLMGSNGDVRRLCATGPAIGVSERPVFEETRVMLEEGERLLLWTDGCTDVTCAAGERFGESRLVREFETARVARPEQTLSQMWTGLTAFGAGEFPDDITLLLISADGQGKSRIVSADGVNCQS